MTEASDTIVLWRERIWRCELHADSHIARLDLYRLEELISTTSIPAGRDAIERAEAIRQRILQGEWPPF